jgi:quercetin dioxygenase-like cupin family protein
MKVQNGGQVEKTKIETFPYKGQPLTVRDVWVQWLSSAGPEDSPEYGLRLFTVGPGGEIPIHQHFYHQTMYVVAGRLTAFEYDPETDEKTAEHHLGVGDYVYIPTMEPHGFVNPDDREDCVFLCCIANVYED